MQYFAVLFRLVNAGFRLIFHLISQVEAPGFARCNGHISFKDCSKLFHRSKSSTGMISTCLLMPPEWWSCAVAAHSLVVQCAHRYALEPRELARCTSPASSNEERGRGWIARGALRRSLGCLSLRVGTLCCEVLKGGSLRIRILELGHCRHLCDGRISDR